MPLVVIVMTWPVFPRIFDRDEFWVHVNHHDVWYKFWDAWHLERVLAGQADYFFTDTIFHPRGVSLAFHQISLPDALLMLALKNILPVDDAYKLLFMLILCFNAFCAYLLIQHLIKDKWIALFGALAVVAATPLMHRSMLPDLITIGTIPLSLYFLHRSIVESRWRFAALAGTFAGVTAFIGMYIFVINLLTMGIYTCFLSLPRWRKTDFWRALLVFFAACGLFGFFRVYPMVADPTMLTDRMQEHPGKINSKDVLDYFVLTHNPFTSSLLRAVFNVPSDSQFNTGYLGYINLLLLASALLFSRRRRRLTPWITLLIFFAVLRLGEYLSFNGAEYRDIMLPEHYLRQWLPVIFGNFHEPTYYHTGIVVPLAVLSCFGLSTLLPSTPPKRRTALLFLCALILAVEFYAPLNGRTEAPEKTAYVDWLQTTTDNPNRLLHLPTKHSYQQKYYQYLQTLTELPHVFGKTNFVPPSAESYVRSNLLLGAWRAGRSIHCLHYNEQAYIKALDSLLESGSTYIVVHMWRADVQFVMPSLANLPALYDNGFVSVYSLQDLRLNCQNQGGELPQFTHLAQSSWATPGSHASIVSFHPSQSIDTANFRYLRSLFSHWKSLLHVYLDKGELVIQNGGAFNEDVDAFARDNQIVYLVYNANTSDESPTDTLKFLNRFSFCRRESHDDGSVIEFYLNPEFSCVLYTSDHPFQVRYHNGAQLENLLYEVGQDYLDIQLRWSIYPRVSHSISFQFFDADGVKTLGQDYVVSRTPFARHQIDISNLPAGEYSVNIVYYNFETGESVPGAVSGSGARFDRALEITTIRKS